MSDGMLKEFQEAMDKSFWGATESGGLLAEMEKHSLNSYKELKTKEDFEKALMEFAEHYRPPQKHQIHLRYDKAMLEAMDDKTFLFFTTEDGRDNIVVHVSYECLEYIRDRRKQIFESQHSKWTKSEKLYKK